VNNLASYTAKQVTHILEQDDPHINLRTIRYYTQMGIIPPLELVGNKRVYTDKHIHYFRAILTLSKTGETLAVIHKKLGELSMEEVVKIGEKIHLYGSNTVLTNETLEVSDDVFITVSPRISAELKQKMVDSVSNLLKGNRDI
jgi:DNA-binding transcriptional MerR regulator